MSERKTYLVQVHPQVELSPVCPKCGSASVEVTGSVFPGIHVLASATCRSCGYRFVQDLPVGFAVDHPMAIGVDDGKLHNPLAGEGWIYEPLKESWNNKSSEDVRIERIVHRECKEVIILNTLDYLYGHVLLKLFNASYYLKAHADKGLVLILPRMYAWLIPEGVAEVWLVDQRLSKAHGWYEAINAFAQAQLPRYDRAYLGMGYAHPEFADIDIAQYSKVPSFRMEDYASAPKHITFILRTDRLWFSSGFEKFCWRAFHALGVRGSLGKVVLARQSSRMRRTMRAIKAQVPDVSFSVVGLGNSGGFNGLADDLRTMKMSEATEVAWCKAYARSQFVIGVHGSNMLLPTAHAAGCINVLPHDRFGNMVQDVCVRWHDRMQLFLYRFVDEFASPNEVARHAVSMFRDFGVYFRDNRTNIFSSER